MARKLRIFAGERHAFEAHPDLVPWQAPPRKLRQKGMPFDIPEGYEPFNPEAYHRRFRMGREQQQQQPEGEAATATDQQQQQAAADDR